MRKVIIYILALLALLVLDVSVGAQFPVPWGEPLTLRGAASFCLDFAPRPEGVDGIWQRADGDYCRQLQ